MAKGTKQIRIGRVIKLKEKYQRLYDFHNQFQSPEDQYSKGVSRGIFFAIDYLLEEFPELKENYKEGQQ
ncbi:hypothetical protein D3C71_1282190 [compost metagenome]